jgi:hypothetical protein
MDDRRLPETSRGPKKSLIAFLKPRIRKGDRAIPERPESSARQIRAGQKTDGNADGVHEIVGGAARQGKNVTSIIIMEAIKRGIAQTQKLKDAEDYSKKL